MPQHCLSSYKYMPAQPTDKQGRIPIELVLQCIYSLLGSTEAEYRLSNAAHSSPFVRPLILASPEHHHQPTCIITYAAGPLHAVKSTLGAYRLRLRCRLCSRWSFGAGSLVSHFIISIMTYLSGRHTLV